MTNFRMVSVLTLGFALIMGCGEGDDGAGDAPPSNPGDLMETMEAGSGVGGGAIPQTEEVAVEATEPVTEAVEEVKEEAKEE